MELTYKNRMKICIITENQHYQQNRRKTESRPIVIIGLKWYLVKVHESSLELLFGTIQIKHIKMSTGRKQIHSSSYSRYGVVSYSKDQ